jgi:heterotetrameric sarcosine oxidase gamma subunit
MPDIRSALSSQLKTGSYGAIQISPGLILCEQQPGTLFQVAGWDRFERDIAPLLAQYGFSGSGNYQQVQNNGDSWCFTIAPDRIMIRDTSGAGCVPAVDDQTLAVIDQSHARTIVRMQGAEVEAVLSRLAPIDFSAAAFPPACFVQCGIDHVNVLIQRVSEDCFELFIPYTWASSVWQVICINAAQFGYQVEAN